MDDTLKDVGYALIGLILLSGLGQKRMEHAATRELGKAIKGGHVSCSVRPKGLLGLVIGESSTTRLFGHGFSTDSLPFRLREGGGARARVGHLELDFQDITLKSLPVRSLKADIPNVSLDIHHVVWNDRVVLRRAGEGTAEATVGIEGLKAFLAKKYPMLQNPEVKLTSGLATVVAKVAILGPLSTVEATGKLEVKEGRYIYVIEPQMTLNGKPAAPPLAASIFKSLNPIVDAERDLGLAGFVTLTSVEICDGLLIVRGKAIVPKDRPETKP